MSRSIRPAEVVLLFAVLAAGSLLRASSLHLEAVEHFDEGVYSSVLWYDAQAGTPWPSREFYAPPGLPLLIEICGLFPFAKTAAPFLPAVLCGLLMPLVAWWFNRQWFGSAAALIAAGIIAGSDIHVMYSRMSMTDVPALLFVLLATGLGVTGIFRRRYSTCILSGLTAGLGWWLKYTGWLACAITASGSLAWWLWSGRRTHSLRPLLTGLVLQAATTFLVFSPYLLQLQELGGYSAIVSHHLEYSRDLNSWWDNLLEHLQYQHYLDGMTGAIAIAVSLLATTAYRWYSEFRFTWNGSGRKAVEVLFRMIAAAIFLLLIGLRVGATRVLFCVAIGSIPGLLIWPLKSPQFGPSKQLGNSAPPPARTVFLPQQPSALGLWVLIAWICGLLLTVPLYSTYPRLFLPLLCPVWLVAAAGLGWWLEAGIRTARRIIENGPRPVAPPSRNRISTITVLAIVALSTAMTGIDEFGRLYLLEPEQLLRCSLMTNRTSLISAATEIADVCCATVDGIDVNPRQTIDGEVIVASQLRRFPPPPVPVPQLTPRQRRATGAHVYAFGEPALLSHLSAAGLNCVPVSHVNCDQLRGPDPVFFVLGPNARRSKGFWEQWFVQAHKFRWLGDFDYVAGPVTTTNLYPSGYLADHHDAAVQRLEVFVLPGFAGQNTTDGN